MTNRSCSSLIPTGAQVRGTLWSFFFFFFFTAKSDMEKCFDDRAPILFVSHAQACRWSNRHCCWWFHAFSLVGNWWHVETYKGSRRRPLASKRGCKLFTVSFKSFISRECVSHFCWASRCFGENRSKHDFSVLTRKLHKIPSVSLQKLILFRTLQRKHLICHKGIKIVKF